MEHKRETKNARNRYEKLDIAGGMKFEGAMETRRLDTDYYLNSSAAVITSVSVRLPCLRHEISQKSYILGH